MVAWCETHQWQARELHQDNIENMTSETLAALIGDHHCSKSGHDLAAAHDVSLEGKGEVMRSLDVALSLS